MTNSVPNFQFKFFHVFSFSLIFTPANKLPSLLVFLLLVSLPPPPLSLSLSLSFCLSLSSRSSSFTPQVLIHCGSPWTAYVIFVAGQLSQVGLVRFVVIDRQVGQSDTCEETAVQAVHDPSLDAVHHWTENKTKKSGVPRPSQWSWLAAIRSEKYSSTSLGTNFNWHQHLFFLFEIRHLNVSRSGLCQSDHQWRTSSYSSFVGVSKHMLHDHGRIDVVFSHIITRSHSLVPSQCVSLVPSQLCVSCSKSVCACDQNATQNGSHVTPSLCALATLITWLTAANHGHGMW